MFKRLAPWLSLFVLLTVPASGCGDDVSFCVPGEACTCTNGDGCSDTCDGAGCAYTCTNTDSCHFTCKDGGCSVSATNAGVVSLDCPGGGCALTCTNVDSCAVSGCSDCTCTNNTGFGGTCQ